jgi:prepilin-type N-terminal cleavage/methylation domain-containing protein
MSKLDQAQSGFTLIEVIVALVVASFLLTIVMNGALDARTGLAKAEGKTRTTNLAAALYAERLTVPFSQSPTTGRDGNLNWQSEDIAIARDPRGFFVLAQVIVTIQSDAGRTLYRVSGRKLKAVDPS